MIDPLSDAEKATVLPWQGRKSILEQIRAWDGKSKLRFESHDAAVPNAVRFIPGALDGIMAYNGWDSSEESEREAHINAVIAALQKLKTAATASNRLSLYSIYKETPLLIDADDLCTALIEHSHLLTDDIRPHAQWLVHNAVDVEPMKLGIMLSGLCDYEGCMEDLLVLARHDEFTLFAAVAAIRISSDPTDILWQMAHSTMGWGKIHLVKRLAANIQDRPDIQAWLLSDGCENLVLDEYLSYTCATAGHMRDALMRPMDNRTLDGCARIMKALMYEGPTKDIDDYQDAAECATLLIDIFKNRCNSLYRLSFVDRLKYFVEWPPDLSANGLEIATEPTEIDRWIARADRGWTIDIREEIARKCDRILTQPDQKVIVRETYRSGDRQAEYICWRVAPRVGLDLWPETFEKLKANPLNHSYYSRLLENPSPDRGAAIIEFAEDHIPLNEIATGPSSKRSSDTDREIVQIMDWVLQYMAKEGAYNEAILAAALRCPVIRQRNQALKALRRAESLTIGSLVRANLARNVNDEPDEELRTKAAELLARLP